MRVHLKASRGFTPSLTTAASVARSAVYSSPRPPDGPGCSRWLSCTCCRRHEPLFFYPNANRAPPRPLNAPTSGSTKSTSLVETLATARTQTSTTRSQLPLPPTLPYSPNSVPFQRHIQHLSLAVLSEEPDDSWRSYLALHSSLRRYIPDDLFRSLLACQLSNPHAKQSWTRGLALIKFAKRCGVEAKALGEENLRNALRSGYDLVLRTKVSDLGQYLPELKALWEQVRSSDVPLDIRKGYLRLHRKRIAKNKDERLSRAGDALREVVELCGTLGVEREAGKIVSLYEGPDVALHIHSLRLSAWCAERGLALSDDTFLVMLRLHQIWSDQGLDPLSLLRSTVVNVTASMGGEDLIGSVLSDVEHRYRTPASRTAQAATTGTPNPQLIRETLRLLQSDNQKMDTALDAVRTLISRNADVAVLVTATLDRLRTDPSLDHLLRFTSLLVSTDMLPNIRPDHLRWILRLLVRSLETDQAYLLSRRVYSVARQCGFRWSADVRDDWHTLFHQAVHRSRRHLHFASRLYADLQADGMAVHRNDHLAFIRAIGMTQSASRSILLDRHIKDFLQTKDAMSPESFVVALVEGLTSTGSAHDASIAFDLSHQVLQDRPMPLVAAERLIVRLATSSLSGHLRKAVHLLDSCSTSDACNHVIFSIIAHSKTDAAPGQMSKAEALSQAAAMYRRMVDLGIEATPRTVSLLLRGLIDARQIEAARGVFDAAAQHGVLLKPNAVGRLMVRLILDDDLDEAADVESRWRQVASTHAGAGKTYDKAIVGARVLLDTKRGVDVDLERIARETGWMSTAPFLRFMESLKPSSSIEDVVENTVSVAYQPDSDCPRDTHSAPPGPSPRRPWLRSQKDRADMDSVAPMRASIVA